MSNLRQGFLDVFASFGKMFEDTLGFPAVKSSDPKSKVGEHFENIGKRLQSTKDKLDGLAKEISSTPHADTKGVETVISSSGEVLTKLIEAVTKLASVTKKGSANIGDNNNSKAVATPSADVEAIIKEVNAIVETATNSGIKIDTGKEGAAVPSSAATHAPTVLAKSNAQASAGAGPALAAEVVKADPWAMIHKIQKAKIATNPISLNASNDNGAGELATGTKNGDDAGAKTNADLAAAVALKAMTQGGQFNAANDAEAVKGAAAGAANKVIGVLEEIIRRTVVSNLDKIGKALKGIKYSETIGEATEVGTATK
nr:variable large family protein [Borrelia coriaceae]